MPPVDYGDSGACRDGRFSQGREPGRSNYNPCGFFPVRVRMSGLITWKRDLSTASGSKTPSKPRFSDPEPGSKTMVLDLTRGF